MMVAPLEDQEPGVLASFLISALLLASAIVITLVAWVLPWVIIIFAAISIWRCSE